MPSPIPPVAAAAASASKEDNGELLAQLRVIMADPSLDDSVGHFFLEMCEGNVDQAANQIQQQQQPAASPAPAPRRATLAASVTTTSSAGGRKRAKAIAGKQAASASVSSSRRPADPTFEPTSGLVTGQRGRGFANNAAILDNAVEFEYMHNSMPRQEASPGAFNETYVAGGEFVVQTRVESSDCTSSLHRSAPAAMTYDGNRDPGDIMTVQRESTGGGRGFANSNAPILGTAAEFDESMTLLKEALQRSNIEKKNSPQHPQRRVSEQKRAPTPMAPPNNLRSDYPQQQQHHYKEPSLTSKDLLLQDDSITDMQILDSGDDDDDDKKPAARPSSTSTLTTATTTATTSGTKVTAAKNDTNDPNSANANRADENSTKNESSLTDFYNDGNDIDVDDHTKKRWNSASTLTVASAEHRLLGDSILSQSGTSLLPDLEEEKGEVGTPAYKPDPPGDTIETPWLSMKTPKQEPTTKMESSSATDRHRKTGKVRRAPATKPGAGSSSEGGHDSASSFEPSSIQNDKRAPTTSSNTTMDQDKKVSKVKRAPASSPGAVSVASDEPFGDVISSSLSHKHPQRRTKDKNAFSPAEAPGPVAQSGSIIAMVREQQPVHALKPKSKEEKGMGSVVDMYEPSSRVQRPHVPTSTALDESNSSTQSALSKGPKERSRRRATRPGAIQATNKTALDESELASMGADTSSQYAADCESKKRRAFVPALNPGAVNVGAEEPATLDESRTAITKSSMDTSNASNEPIQIPTGKVRHNRKPAVQPGVVNVSGGEERETSSREKAKGGKMGRRNAASKPGAVSTTCDRQEVPAKTKAGKFQLGPKPEVVRVLGEETKEPSQTKRKVYKVIPVAKASKPGAVSVKSEEELAESSTGEDIVAVDVQDLSDDPSLEAPPTDETGVDGAQRLLPLPAALPRRNRPRSPGGPRGDARATAHRRVMSDPPVGMPKAPVHGPANLRSSDTRVKTKKGGMFGLFKSRKDKHTKSDGVEEEQKQDAFASLQRTGASRTLASKPGRGPRQHRR